MYCPSPVRSRCSRAKPMDIAAVTPVAWSPDCGCELCRTTIGFADQRRDARIGRAHVVEAGLSAERPALPGQGNRAHDEAGMNGAQFVIAETRSRHDAGGEVLNQHVDLRYDRPDELAAACLLDIDGQALFRVIVLE